MAALRQQQHAKRCCGRSSSFPRATALLLGAAALLALGSCGSAAAAARGRALRGFGAPPPAPLPIWKAAPGNITTTASSCAWTGYDCQGSMAPVFSPSQPLIDETNYPAW